MQAIKVATAHRETRNYRAEYPHEGREAVAINERHREDGELPSPEEPREAEPVSQQHQKDFR